MNRIDLDNSLPLQNLMQGDACFGCGRDNARGLRIQSFYRAGRVVCEWMPQVEHQGWRGNLCGGIIATLVDCHCMAAATGFSVIRDGVRWETGLKYRFVTGNLDLRFLEPTPVGIPVILKAGLVGVRKNRVYTLDCALYSAKTMTVKAEVIAIRVAAARHADGFQEAYPSS